MKDCVVLKDELDLTCAHLSLSALHLKVGEDGEGLRSTVRVAGGLVHRLHARRETCVGRHVEAGTHAASVVHLCLLLLLLPLLLGEDVLAEDRTRGDRRGRDSGRLEGSGDGGRDQVRVVRATIIFLAILHIAILFVRER